MQKNLNIRPDFGYSVGPFTRIQFAIRLGEVSILVPKYRNGLDDKGCLVSTITTFDHNARKADGYRII